MIQVLINLIGSIDQTRLTPQQIQQFTALQNQLQNPNMQNFNPQSIVAIKALIGSFNLQTPQHQITQVQGQLTQLQNAIDPLQNALEILHLMRVSPHNIRTDITFYLNKLNQSTLEISALRNQLNVLNMLCQQKVKIDHIEAMLMGMPNNCWTRNCGMVTLISFLFAVIAFIVSVIFYIYPRNTQNSQSG